MADQKSSIEYHVGYPTVVDKAKGRWKLPWLDFYIVRGAELRLADKRFADIEREFKRILISNQIRARVQEKQLHRIAVMTGRLKAPECPKCGKPKTAGGIQWLDHAECYAQGKKP